MSNRIRFTREQVTEAFLKGSTSSLVKMSIQSEIDQMILDDLCKEMDDELGDILDAGTIKHLKKPQSDGETCTKCKNFYPFAEPNQKDGTLICYSCRKYG